MEDFPLKPPLFRSFPDLVNLVDLDDLDDLSQPTTLTQPDVPTSAMSNYLNARYSVVTFQILEGVSEQNPLVDELQPFLPLTPYFIYDLEGILLTSYCIGELINVANTVRTLWAERFPGFGLINVNDTSQKVLEQIKLQALFHVYPDLQSAKAGVTEKEL